MDNIDRIANSLQMPKESFAQVSYIDMFFFKIKFDWFNFKLTYSSFDNRFQQHCIYISPELKFFLDFILSTIC